MVHFMFKNLREEPGGATLEPLAVDRACAERDAFVPTRGAVDAAHRETTLILFLPLA